MPDGVPGGPSWQGLCGGLLRFWNATWHLSRFGRAAGGEGTGNPLFDPALAQWTRLNGGGSEAKMRNIVPDERVRQGPAGLPVLGVLVGALFLCAVALTGYLLWVGSESPDSVSQNASRELTTGSPSGSTANPSTRVPPGNPAYPAPSEPSSTGGTNR